MNEQPQEERRQYKRIKRSFILSYFDMADPDKQFEVTQLKNISLGGMCFVSTNQIEARTRLGVHVRTPYLAEITHLEGVVLESHEKIKDTIYETRMTFESIDEKALFVLNKFIEYFTSKEQETDE